MLQNNSKKNNMFKSIINIKLNSSFLSCDFFKKYVSNKLSVNQI
jgi:hypothetical protein